ncbi:MAG: HAMP domain-containing protein, partial [Bacteroidota bacterium]
MTHVNGSPPEELGQRTAPRPPLSALPRRTHTVLFRMVLGQALIALLLVAAVAISVWQISVYNEANKVWETTSERSRKIDDVLNKSTVLVLVTHRIVFTQAPFVYINADSVREPTEAIRTSISDLEGSRDKLLEVADTMNGHLAQPRLYAAAGYVDKLVQIAEKSATLGEAKNWREAKGLLSSTDPTSTVPHFENVHSELAAALRWAQHLVDLDRVKAVEQMAEASSRAIAVIAGSVLVVVALWTALSTRTIRSINRPVRQLSEAAARLAEGQFDTRAPEGSQDELGQLARVFNYMAGELQKLYVRLEARAGTAEARLLQAVESIPLGVELYDADDELVLCNEKYRKMRPEIVDVVVPGAHFADIEAQAAERGCDVPKDSEAEAWVAKRLAQHRNQPGTFELALDDGRWLQVSEFRTNEGGVFGIREDIT